ncbi:MAG: ChrR family anti-sigma-E factor [Pseudomonadota bacterium]
MTIHHAPETLLADYASGSATPGLSLLVATHLTYAPEARARVSEFEAIGGAALQAAPQATVSEDLLTATLAALDARPCRSSECEGGADATASVLPRRLRADGDSDVLPAPIRRALNGASPQWRFRLPGVSEAMIDGYDGEQVSLLRARPGASIPQHTHEGREITLIMQGALADGDRVYRRGDVAMNDEHDDHRPRIIGDETCICLIVMEGSLRFTGRFSRALNLLGE